MFTPIINGEEASYKIFITKKVNKYGRIEYDDFTFLARIRNHDFMEDTSFEFHYAKGKMLLINGWIIKKYYKNHGVWEHTLHIESVIFVNNYTLVDFL